MYSRWFRFKTYVLPDKTCSAKIEQSTARCSKFIMVTTQYFTISRAMYKLHGTSNARKSRKYTKNLNNQTLRSEIIHVQLVTLPFLLQINALLGSPFRILLSFHFVYQMTGVGKLNDTESQTQNHREEDEKEFVCCHPNITSTPRKFVRLQN